MRNVFVLIAILVGLTATTLAQNPQPSATPAQTTTVPTAKPDDVKSIDSIIAAVYDVISGPAEKQRDWDRFRSLFIPGARLIPTGPRQTGYGSRVLSIDDYVTRAGGAMAREGFYEKEVARRSENFGQIAHAFST